MENRKNCENVKKKGVEAGKLLKKLWKTGDAYFLWGKPERDPLLRPPPQFGLSVGTGQPFVDLFLFTPRPVGPESYPAGWIETIFIWDIPKQKPKQILSR